MAFKDAIMPLAVKKKQQRTIARCGNSAVLYLPKGYFIPGENVDLGLEIDFDGNLKLTLKKCLYNFNCTLLKSALKGFKIDQDAAEEGTVSFSAVNGNLMVNCVGYIQELEPTYVTVTRLFDAVNSSEVYTAIVGFVDKLRQTCPEAYIEAEGDIDAVKIFKNPQKYHLENEVQAVEFLRKTGKRLSYSVNVKFNSKHNKLDFITQILNLLSQSDAALLGPA
jgi:hypothetical protein